MKKKVLILTSVHPVFDVRIFYKEARTLVGAGYSVALIAQHHLNETVDGVKILALSKPKNRFFRIFGTNWKIFRLALKQKTDIYHFHDPELIFIGIFLKLFKKKVIYDVHEDYEVKILNKNWIPKFLRKTLSIGFGIFEKLFSKIFDYIIVVDNTVYSKFQRYLIDKIITIRNFPPIYNFKRKNKKNKNKSFVCVYIGGLSKDRGLFKMVKALEYVDFPIELFLLGKFENKEDLNKFKKNKKVKYLGQRSWLKIMKFLAISDAGLNLLQPVPAYFYAGENTTKIFEYMMMGLPVISSNFPNLRKIIEKNKCGICVNPINPKKIAEAIKYLIEYPEKAKKMGEKGRKAVLKKYNWNKEGKKLLEIYEKLCKK